MKKTLVVFASIVMLLASSLAFADDASVTLGVKSWANSWKETFDDNAGTTSSTNYGSAMMVGPSLNIKFGKPFIGITYLQTVSDYKTSDVFVAGDTLQFERKDLDLTFGVMFARHFGLFIGYKTLEAPGTYTDSFGSSTATWKLKGPGAGLTTSIPIGRAAAFYGNLAFMRMKQEWEAGGVSTPSFDLTGFSGEVGLAFSMSEGLAANVGFKGQSFWGDDDNGNTWTETFTGLTVGVNYTFK